MTQKSFNPKTEIGVVRATRRIFGIGIPATMVLSAVLAVAFAIALDGCSQHENKKQPVSSSSQNAASPSTVASSLPAPGPDPTPAVTPAKKPVVKRPPTVAYRNNTAGLSFSYPRNYKMVTAEKAQQDEAVLERIPMKFVQPGGATVATVELPGTAASSFFNVSLSKNLTQEQCGQFAPPEPAQNSSGDSALSPAKVTISGVEFTMLENVNDLVETRYYHRFEGDTCYEFALWVEESPDNVKPVDHGELLDKMEKILATVKIKSETAQAVTASVPEQTGSSNPQ